ncbi:hypothetical protein ASG52_11195 [Methylobacterium sp. Leaf456]|uniref:hypothetical protein n=1 Tax=Methylobacterium sp. Leaf456 TaxID=1736382 RepID=UPI0006F8E22C|nr:hypothetical protein [Methylobacterium sp. Leaf456]KQT47823.1 hypothetical protein ASG52_11195 [Methylobacterium sp. Leaf456]
MSGRSHTIRRDESWPERRSAPPAAFRELDRVRTLEVVAGEDGETVPVGSEGTVVAVWNGGEAFDVEFVRPVETLAAILPTALQLIERKDG